MPAFTGVCGESVKLTVCVFTVPVMSSLLRTRLTLNSNCMIGIEVWVEVEL
ncbi:hypothetical protein [Prosthecobacter sp.]|uniref:hypothetical protein n=1 Tax=Prosthecobacter sp. TaxID=1965333 RepID=UPI003783522B